MVPGGTNGGIDADSVSHRSITATELTSENARALSRVTALPNISVMSPPEPGQIGAQLG